MPIARWLVPLTRFWRNRSWRRFSSWRISCSRRYRSSLVSRSISAASRASSNGAGSTGSLFMAFPGHAGRYWPLARWRSLARIGAVSRTSCGSCPPPGLGVEVRFGLAQRRQRAVDRPVARATDEQLLGGAAGDHLAAIGGDDDLLLDARRRPAVARRPVRLEGEDHALLEHLRVLERQEPAEDRSLPDRQAHTVSILQGERGHLVGEAELGRRR